MVDNKQNSFNNIYNEKWSNQQRTAEEQHNQQYNNSNRQYADQYNNKGYYDQEEEEQDIFNTKLSTIQNYSVELNSVINSQNQRIQDMNNPMKNTLSRVKQGIRSVYKHGENRFGNNYSYILAFGLIFVLFFLFFFVG